MRPTASCFLPIGIKVRSRRCGTATNKNLLADLAVGNATCSPRLCYESAALTDWANIDFAPLLYLKTVHFTDELKPQDGSYWPLTATSGEIPYRPKRTINVMLSGGPVPSKKTCVMQAFCHRE